MERGDDKCNAALRYCEDKYQWIVEKCRYAMKVRRFQNYMNDGQDLAHTVCQACGTISDEKWLEIDNHEAYITSVIRNAANLAYRNRTNTPIIDIEDLNNLPNQPHSNELIEEVLLLKELLSTLPEDRRELLEMAEVENLSGKEIAELVGVTYATVRQRLSRTRRELKDLLLGTDAGPPPPA